MSKNTWIVQPYLVGTRNKKASSKDGRSLVVCIPRDIAQKYNVTPDSAFRISSDPDKKILQLSMILISEGTVEKRIPPGTDAVA